MKKAYVAFYKEGSFIGAYPLGSSYTMPGEVVGAVAKLEYREFDLCSCGSPKHAGPCFDTCEKCGTELLGCSPDGGTTVYARCPSCEPIFTCPDHGPHGDLGCPECGEIPAPASDEEGASRHKLMFGY